METVEIHILKSQFITELWNCYKSFNTLLILLSYKSYRKRDYQLRMRQALFRCRIIQCRK